AIPLALSTGVAAFAGASANEPSEGATPLYKSFRIAIATARLLHTSVRDYSSALIYQVAMLSSSIWHISVIVYAVRELVTQQPSELIAAPFSALSIAGQRDAHPYYTEGIVMTLRPVYNESHAKY